jgi:hypothetical protein
VSSGAAAVVLVRSSILRGRLAYCSRMTGNPEVIPADPIRAISSGYADHPKNPRVFDEKLPFGVHFGVLELRTFR